MAAAFVARRVVAHRREPLVQAWTMRALILASFALAATPASAQPAPGAPADAPPTAAPVVDAPVADEAAPARALPPRTMGTLQLDAARDGVPVIVDGVDIGRTPLPGPWTLPPGPHTVVLRPEGASPEKYEVQIPAGGEVRLEVLTQAAAPAPVVAPEPAVEVVHTGPGFSLATAGYVAAGIGVAALGAGVYLGLDAQSTADEAADLDRRDPRNSRADLEALADDADAAALWANVAYGVGGVALLGGAAMILLASDGPLSRAPVRVTPLPAGAAVGGSF